MHKTKAPKLFPCGNTRREFLWEMGNGFAGLALGSLLAGDRFFTRHLHGAGSSRIENPLTPKPSHFPAKAKSCIFLMMNGAPSQVDTFDFKPELVKYAGKSLPENKSYINSGGRKVGYLTPNWRPFRPGGQSGLLVSDYFPKVREHADKLAVIKSCYADSHAHGSALVGMNTGSTFIGRPSLGSWSVYGLGAYSDEFGHPFRSISDSDSDSVRTLFGAERRCGWIHSGEDRLRQGWPVGSGGSLPSLQARPLQTKSGGVTAPSIGAGGRAAATAPRAAARVAAGRYA